MPRKAEAKVRIKVTDDGSLKKLEKGSRQADRALKGTAKTSSSGTKNFSKMSQGITGGLVPAYATLAANLFAITALFGALKEAADLRVMREGMEAYAATTGQAMQSVSRNLQEVTRMQLDYGEAMKATATLTAAGFSSDMIMEMGEAARNASAAIGHNFEDAFNRITKGIQKAEPELLDELGIVLRLDEATRKYAQAHGLAQKDLTLYQRTLAVHNEVIEQATSKYGELDREIKVSGINQMATAFENIKKTALEGIAPIAEFFAGVFTKHIKLVIISMVLFAVSIMKAAGLGGMMGKKLSGALEIAKAKTDQAKLSAEQYQAQLVRTRGSLEERVGMAHGGLNRMGQNERIMKGQKGMGAEMLRAGNAEKINKRILRNWQQSSKKHIGITKHMTAEEKLDFDQWLADMLADQETLYQKWKRMGTKMLISSQFTWKKIKQTALSATAMIGKGMGKLAGGMMKILSFMGWIGMITMMVTMIKEFWANIDKTIDSVINMGNNLAEMTKESFPRLSGWIARVTGNLDKNTKGWREYKKELREIEDRHQRMKQVNTDFEESFEEIKFIMEGITQDFKDGGDSVELFIKKMKLFESVSFATQLKNLRQDARANLEVMVELVADREAMLADKDWGKRTEVDEKAVDDLDSLVMGMTGGYHMDTAITAIDSMAPDLTEAAQILAEDMERTKELIEEALDLTEPMKYLDNLQLFLDEAKKSGTDVSGVKVEAARTALTQLQTAVTEGWMDEEFYMLNVIEVLKNLGTQYENLSEDVIKPGKAMESIKQTTESFNKEMANMALQSMPKAWGKVYNLFKQVGVELKGIDEEKLLKSALDDKTRGYLNDMGVQLKENMTIEEAKVAIAAREVQLREYAYGLLQKEQLLKSQALDRPGAGVASKLGGALGADVKHHEAMAKFQDQITSNYNKQLDLQKQFRENLIKPEDYAIQITNLKIVEKQLRTNLKVQEEGYSLTFKLADQFQQSFTQIFEEIAKGEKKIGDIFKDVTKMMLQQMAQMMAQMAAIAAMKAMFGATMFGIPIGREGGVFKSPGYKSYAGGGIASGPSSGYLATLHGNEAVVPLGNDKSIPVKFDKSSSYKETNITVNVAAGGQQQTTTTKAGERERKLGQMIAAAVQGEILDQQRPGGILSPYGDGGM